MNKNSGRFPFFAPARPYPTLRALLKGGKGRGSRTRAPWYTGYPSKNNAASWSQSLKRK